MLDIDEPQMFQRFVHRSIPLLAVGLVALAVMFVMAARGRTRGLRVVAALGVGALVWAWGVAQYDYLLPFKMTIAQGSGADITMKWLIGWAIAALVTVLPLLIFLYSLGQRGQLGEDPTTSIATDSLAAEAPQRS
jgi:cytochrome d ubiquinol oxidase subunit II